MESDNIKVLLVEDDIDQRQFWAVALSDSFGEIKAASNGLEALSIINHFQPDIVLSDILLPEMDGFQLCYTLKKHSKTQDIPVVLYSAAYVDPRDKQLAVAYGASRIIQKPVKAAEIIEQVNEVYREQKNTRSIQRRPDTEFEASLSKLHSDIVVKKLGETIRELEQKKKLLETSLDRFQDFAACASELFWETNPDLSLSYLSVSDDEQFCVKNKDYNGKLFSEYFSAHIDASDLNQLQQTLEQHAEFDRTIKWLGCETESKVLNVIAKPFFDADGVFAGYRGVFADVTEQHNRSDKLQFEANHDALTGLPNKRALEYRLERLLVEQENTHHVLCYIDLDFFKTVNDVAGHRAGDELLIQLGQQLSSQVSRTDLLARVGGDEFVVLLEQCNLEQAQRLVQNLHKAINKFRFIWKHRTFQIGASIGLAALKASSLSSVEDVINRADAACYVAKSSGGNRIHVHSDACPPERDVLSESSCLEKIQRAFEEDDFLLYKQPIVSTSGIQDGCEILVRLKDGDGMMQPSEFMPVIHRHHLFPKLDTWVVKATLEWMSAHPEILRSYSFLSINLSGQSLTDEMFRQNLFSHFKTMENLCSKICFEITETTAIENLSDAVDFIHRVRDFGCQFALDDFGTGFSSLAYLRNLPIDFIKIDGLFVTGVADDPLDYSMLESIQQLASILSIKTVAEFVENAELAEKVKKVGVDYAQGDYIGKPVKLDDEALFFDWDEINLTTA
ncbi:MAG TPA: EAL domain-containing protein [Chromatiales bacterium]|nr:EAL domain-containing protein [Thiotrichales bacterium]HIP68358.1 EAL domain-containing protein [Chromatiales bacterium]